MGLVRHSISTFIFQIIGYGLLVISGIISAHILQPFDRGLSAAVIFYPNLFFTLGHLTLGLCIIHHIGKKKYALEEFAGSSFLFALILSILMGIFFLVTVLLFKETFYRNIDIRYLLVGMISLPFLLLVYFFSSIMQGMLNITWYNIVNILPRLIILFLIIILALFWRFRAMEMVIIFVFGSIISGVLCFYKLWQMSSKKWSINKNLFMTLLKDGSKIHLASIATFIYGHVNIWIINYYLSPSEVGYYHIAYNLAYLLFLISISVEAVLYPRTSLGSLDEAIRLAVLSCRQVLFITLISGVIMGLLAKYLIILYGGSTYLPAQPVLLLLIPGMIVFIIPKILSTIWVRKGWFLFMSITAIIIATLNISLGFLLVPRYGVNGAGLSLTITYGFAALMGIVLYYLFVNRNIFKLFLLAKEDWQIYKDVYNKVKTQLIRSNNVSR